MGKQDSQKEAEKNNELPEGAPLLEAVPVEQYATENDQVKDKLKEFGATDLEQFLARVTSDSIFGKQVVRKLLGLDGDKSFVDYKHVTSPQECNQTGVLDHSTYPPKVKGGADGATKDTNAA